MNAHKTPNVSAKDRKILLHDPVTKYQQLNPQASDKSLAALTDLCQQYAETSQQLKEHQNKSKKISREIGEAKRASQPCEKLLQLMQLQSAESKNIKNQLTTITRHISRYFESDSITEESPSTENPSAKNHLPPTRIHTKQSSVDNSTSIALLNNEFTAWNKYVESNPAASLYHRAEWKNLILKVFNHESYYFYAICNKKIVGVLPLVRLNSRLFGDFMVSMPYFNSGGAIANNLAVEQKLMQTASNHAKKIGVSHIEYRDDIRRNELPVRDEKVNMILSLPNTPDILWNSFSSKLRSQVRRAQRENITIDIGSPDNFNSFYIVFAKNMRDLGTPVYSKLFFKHILKTFPRHSKIIVIHLNNKPVATAFLLGHKTTLEIPWASTIKEVNHLSINMLLYWEVLKFAIENNYHYFDFGRSSKNSGTFQFKQQWGAKPKQCYWHYWLKDGAELPSLNPNNPKYKLLISLWKKIPVSITKYIGPNIVKNLP